MKIISFANQKGGVGKTTSVANMAAAFAKAGKRVLAVDFDPQANLTNFLGLSSAVQESRMSIANLMKLTARGQCPPIAPAILHSAEGFDLLPSHVSLADAELYLVTAMSRETVLKRILSSGDLPSYDYLMIDCNPSLGLLLTNALVASSGVIVPVQVQPFAMDGLGTLFQTVSAVAACINPDLSLYGVLLTMKDRTIMSCAVDIAISQAYEGQVFDTRIPRRINAVNVIASNHTSVAVEDDVGMAYQSAADELLKRLEGEA